MRSTLVGVFENRHAAERARDELLRAGFADDEVDLRTGTDDRAWRDSDDSRLAAADRSAYDDETQASIGETVADWFRSLFGMDDDQDVGIYTEAVRRGESVVTVNTADEDRVDRASDILEACGSIDIDEKANEWQLQGWARPSGVGDASIGGSSATPSAPLGATAASAGAMGAASGRDVGEPDAAAARSMDTPTTERASEARAGEDMRAGESRTIPVIEEQLRVGKRIVGRRRLRVYTRMVEEPVEENVRLTEERVHVERRDADRPATDSDYRAAQGKSIEVTERSEEPMVTKEARVVGEVEIGKEKHERQETVRDTVRHSDVEVRKLDETDSAAAASTKPMRPEGASPTGPGSTHAQGTPATGADDSPAPPNIRR
ncbi:MAG TPA: YsnF/AvaK domain-containing protein [Zeimonas sp.]